MSATGREDFVKVAIHGVPRSGTSWIGEILNSSPNTAYRYQPLFSYAHKDYLTPSSGAEDIDSFFVRLRHCEDDFTNQKTRRASGDFPGFDKSRITHVAYKEVRYVNILPNLMRRSDDVLLCAVVRNPRSVINSWLRAPREFRRDLGWSEIEEWRYALRKNMNRPEEFHGFEKWKEATNLFLRLREANPDRVNLVKYSDMIADPVASTASLFGFLGLQVTQQTRDFLKDSMGAAKKDAYAVFRSNPRDDAWKMQLDARIADEIERDLRGSRLEEFL